MYNFSILPKSLTPTYELILLGLQMNLFDISAAADLVYWKMENDLPVSDFDIELLNAGEDTIPLLSAAPNIEPIERDEALLRYAILCSLDSTGEQLLHDLEDVYADFNYPEDMESFIYYMPIENATGEDIIANPITILVNRFRTFMTAEKIRLNLS